MVSLGARIHHRPRSSGGQQQRGASRSLVNDPTILLADEPTGNLDSATSDEILELLGTQRGGQDMILVTHGTTWPRAPHRAHQDGLVVSDERRKDRSGVHA